MDNFESLYSDYNNIQYIFSVKMTSFPQMRVTNGISVLTMVVQQSSVFEALTPLWTQATKTLHDKKETEKEIR